MSIKEKIETVALPVIAEKGCELVGIDIVPGKVNQRATVNLYVDQKPNGVSLDQCSEIAKSLGLVLDVELPDFDRYVLSVSSPGLDRLFFKVEQLQPYVGETLKVRLLVPIMGQRNFRGELLCVEGDKFEILSDEQKHSILFEQVDKVQLVPDFTKLFSSSKRPEVGKHE